MKLYLNRIWGTMVVIFCHIMTDDGSDRDAKYSWLHREIPNVYAEQFCWPAASYITCPLQILNEMQYFDAWAASKVTIDWLPCCHCERRNAVIASDESCIFILISYYTLGAPKLGAVGDDSCQNYVSYSVPVATRARDHHNTEIRLLNQPWWRKLGDEFQDSKYEDENIFWVDCEVADCVASSGVVIFYSHLFTYLPVHSLLATVICCWEFFRMKYELYLSDREIGRASCRERV